MILVYWLVTSAALVATAVKELAPSASGTPKKTNRPFGFEVVVAPEGSNVTVTFGSVLPTKVTVASVVMPSPTGAFRELTSRLKTGLCGWRRGNRRRRRM